MTGRRAIVGLCMLCALMISAVAAQGASAEQAYTCGANLGNKDFSDSHCKTNVGSGNGGFGHLLITEKTNITGTSEATGSPTVTKLKSVQAGVTLEIQATSVSGTGEMENSGGNASGSGTLTYKGVTVTAPAGKGCSVVGGEVKTNKLAATTAGLTKQLKFSPFEGETFASFEVTGCSNAALNHVYTAKGSVKGDVSGATTTTTHAGTTEQNTLSLSGQKAGIEGSLMIKGANGNGLALT
jgi:hypothetical protein